MLDRIKTECLTLFCVSYSKGQLTHQVWFGSSAKNHFFGPLNNQTFGLQTTPYITSQATELRCAAWRSRANSAPANAFW